METKHGELTKIADKAECSVQALCNITKGRRRPSPELAKRLEQATGIKAVAWLWPHEYKNPFVRHPAKRRSKEGGI